MSEEETKITKDDLERFERLYAAKLTATLIATGRPDLYQYNQNELIHAVADFLLEPYIQFLKEENG